MIRVHRVKLRDALEDVGLRLVDRFNQDMVEVMVKCSFEPHIDELYGLGRYEPFGDAPLLRRQNGRDTVGADNRQCLFHAGLENQVAQISDVVKGR